MLSKCMQAELAQIEREHAAKIAKFNAADRHPLFSRPCKTCGRQFLGGDWQLIPSAYCSKKCELADNTKLSPYRRTEINLFWRDFGKYFAPING